MSNIVEYGNYEQQAQPWRVERGRIKKFSSSTAGRVVPTQVSAAILVQPKARLVSALVRRARVSSTSGTKTSA